VPSIRLYFKWTMASQLLFPQTEEKLYRPKITGFGALMKQLNEEGLLQKMDYSVVFTALRKKHSIAPEDPIWIFVAHDEMQFLTSYNTLLDLSVNPNQDKKRATLLYQYLMESIIFAQTAKEFGIHVLNIYSGTFRLNVTSILEATGHRWRPLKFDPLTVDDGLQLLAAKHPNLAQKMKSDVFKQVLSHHGNVPRIWRAFSEVIGKEVNPSIDPTNLADLNEKLKTEVKNIYGRSDKFNLLLLLAIQGWTLEDAMKMLSGAMQLQVSELQNSGLLFLVEGRFFVPPILLQSLAGDFQVAIKRILTHFPDRMLTGMFTSMDFEEFCIGFFTLKRNLLVSQGIRTIPIMEFFKGAWISPEIADRTITLAEGDSTTAAILYKTQTARLDSLEHVNIGSDEILNVKNNGPVALWIGNNDPYQDGVLLLSNTLVQFEMKYSVGNAQQALTGNSASSFESEQKKAESSPLRLTGGTNVFVYITNCRMTSDEEKRKAVQHQYSIIICANTFKAVFSPTFEYVTSRIKNSSIASVEEISPAASAGREMKETEPKQPKNKPNTKPQKSNKNRPTASAESLSASSDQETEPKQSKKATATRKNNTNAKSKKGNKTLSTTSAEEISPAVSDQEMEETEPKRPKNKPSSKSQKKSSKTSEATKADLKSARATTRKETKKRKAHDGDSEEERQLKRRKLGYE
jgi:hypothetical protein